MSHSQSSACLIHASRLPCTPRTLKHDVLTTTMLHCGSRIAKLFRSPVTPPFNFPRRLLIKFEFSSLFQAKGLNTSDEESDEFLPWLERKARTKISSMLWIGKSAYGRSLFASENIRTGDCILKVPYSVEITPDNLLPKIRAILSDKIGTVSKLAIILLVERKMGQSSGWAPYICCLPQHGEIHSTIFWSEYELNMICQSSVYQETVNQKAKIEKDFAAVVPALQQFPDLESITLQDFMCAYFSVTSRAWESTKGLSLIPFTDFMNHDGGSKSIVLFDDDKMFSEVIADRNYAPGEEGEVIENEDMTPYSITLSRENLVPSEISVQDKTSRRLLDRPDLRTYIREGKKEDAIIQSILWLDSSLLVLFHKIGEKLSLIQDGRRL
ncbi:hypothetical protein E1A91_A05G383800v1 [Gossypium mustelinum]|uniref:Uncharacterized protein n=1 Tax=Gossypium mustelinum TaxID=34275 RepID=A0A5D2ZGX8_GOSMU|nr:hypothetical protein E1A91_A05G383800v1 [Gossypium mustelinum]